MRKCYTRFARLLVDGWWWYETRYIGLRCVHISSSKAHHQADLNKSMRGSCGSRIDIYIWCWSSLVFFFPCWKNINFFLLGLPSDVYPCDGLRVISRSDMNFEEKDKLFRDFFFFLYIYIVQSVGDIWYTALVFWAAAMKREREKKKVYGPLSLLFCGPRN